MLRIEQTRPPAPDSRSFALLAAIAAVIAWQAAPRDPPAPTSNTARVHGHLVVNGVPMNGCRVTLSHRPWLGIPPNTLTGVDGSFEFESVAAGEDRIVEVA